MSTIMLKPALILAGVLLTRLLSAQGSVRLPVDPIGFATRSWQMDSVVARTARSCGRMNETLLQDAEVHPYTSWKAVLCPHDDYAYAGCHYPLVLKNVQTPVVILIGVAHKARKFGVADRIVFDRYESWKAPYGPVRVSYLREKIMNQLPRSVYAVNDSLHQAEHSLEAIVPWLQHANRRVEIVPILVPYMAFNTMDGLARSLARAIARLCEDEVIKRNRDITLVISNDAVHYGDEGWGGAHYAPYGVDSSAYKQAVGRDLEIVRNYLTGEVTPEKLRGFSKQTVQDTNHTAYRWSWCGRYAVPFGLLTAGYLQEYLHLDPLHGRMLKYSTSLEPPLLNPEELRMGKTAEATLRHWVGYVSIGYN